MSDVTLLLAELERGKTGSAEQLLHLVYSELRRIADWKMAQERAPTLQPTALVHEAWLKLAGHAQPGWRSRAHFFGAAAEAMRRILIDRARRRRAQRRGGGLEHVNVDDLEVAAALQNDDRLLALDEALGKLATLDAPKAELVRLRYFAGLSIEDAAAALQISPATAKRWWTFARAWLFEEIRQA